MRAMDRAALTSGCQARQRAARAPPLGGGGFLAMAPISQSLSLSVTPTPTLILNLRSPPALISNVQTEHTSAVLPPVSPLILQQPPLILFQSILLSLTPNPKPNPTSDRHPRGAS